MLSHKFNAFAVIFIVVAAYAVFAHELLESRVVFWTDHYCGLLIGCCRHYLRTFTVGNSKRDGVSRNENQLNPFARAKSPFGEASSLLHILQMI